MSFRGESSPAFAGASAPTFGLTFNARARVAPGLHCTTRVEKTDEYRDWIDGLRDLHGRARILMRVDRLIHGNPGDHRNLTGGISDLRIDTGPGYRVYYAKRGERLLLLLVGGDKSTQDKDIAKAMRLAAEHLE